MFEEFKGKSSGINDCHGNEVKEGNVVRWMADDGECYKGKVEFGEPKEDEGPFLSGFAIFNPENIEIDTDNKGEPMGWTGELEIIPQ